MPQVSLDTSFLISFANPTRDNHATAQAYFRHCVERGIPMWISTVVAGEFAVKQSFTDLPLKQFLLQPYNLTHALTAADFVRAIKEMATETDRRTVVINDLKILAQAEREEIKVVLAEDKNTMWRLATSLREKGKLNARVLLLKDGFTPGKLENPDQEELALSA
jgi:predicted nucleic acid-binding protein